MHQPWFHRWLHQLTRRSHDSLPAFGCHGDLPAKDNVQIWSDTGDFDPSATESYDPSAYELSTKRVIGAGSASNREVIDGMLGCQATGTNYNANTMQCEAPAAANVGGVRSTLPFPPFPSFSSLKLSVLHIVRAVICVIICPRKADCKVQG